MGCDGAYSTTAEAFSCDSLASGQVLLDCGATDVVGSVEAIEAISDKAQEAFGADADWVSVDTIDRPVYKYGDGKRKQALSKVRLIGYPGRQHVAHLQVHDQEKEGVPVLFVC